MVNTVNIVPIMVPAESVAPQTAETPRQTTAPIRKVSMHSTTPERPITGTSVRISVPLDASIKRVPVYPDHTTARRDSMDRREALLKGKEGSRQRRRWENGRTMQP